MKAGGQSGPGGVGGGGGLWGCGVPRAPACVRLRGIAPNPRARAIARRRAAPDYFAAAGGFRAAEARFRARRPARARGTAPRRRPLSNRSPAISRAPSDLSWSASKENDGKASNRRWEWLIPTGESFEDVRCGLSGPADVRFGGAARRRLSRGAKIARARREKARGRSRGATRSCFFPCGLSARQR